MTVTLWTGKRAVLADTGPLFAATDPKDQYHARARQEIQRLARERQRVVIPFPTLWECYSMVVRRLGPVPAHSWLTDVRTKGILIAPSAEDYAAAMDQPPRYAEHPITLFDALLAVMSQRLDLPVWTYDHHFDVMRIPVWR